jgi:tetratricopeptide (TPR) repeat protein
MEAIIRTNCIISAITLLLLSLGLRAQDYTEIQDAFKESYSLESNAEYNQAIEVMKSVYDENSYEINLRLGWLSYSLGNFTESIAYYQKSISLKPFGIEARFGLTLPASALGNWEMVRQQYLQVLEVDPMNTKANYYLGMIHYNRGEYETADNYFEKVANLYPFDYDGMIMYAWSNYQLGKLREAKVLFNKVLMIRPGDESALEGLQLIQ